MMNNGSMTVFEELASTTTVASTYDAVVSNCSVESHDADKPMLFIMCVMYALITAFALVGNGMVCYVVLAYPRMRTVTNVFIVNLAVGDILMSVFCVPFTFVANFVTQCWVFGYPMCVIVGYCQAISVMVSAYTLIAISMDRYMAIMYPFKPRLTGLQARVIIVIVWGVALVTPMPSAFKLTLIPHPDCPSVQYCNEDWTSMPDLEAYYSYGLLSLQYILPLLVLIVTYSRIAVTVWGKEIPGEAEDQRDRKMAQSKRKMIKMMICVVSVFALCWMPLNVYILLLLVYPELNESHYAKYIYFGSHWIAMSHTCYNPIIYCWLNAKFRQGFYRLFCSRKSRSSQRRNTYTSYVSCNNHQLNTNHVARHQKQPVVHEPLMDNTEF